MVDKRTAQRALKRNIELTDAQIGRFTVELKRFLERTLENILEGVEEEDIRAEEAAAVLGSLTSTLEAVGLKEELGEITALYGTELEYLRETFERSGASRRVFTEADLDTVRTLIEFDVSALQDNVNAYVSDIRSAVMRTVMSGERPDVKTLVTEFTDKAVTSAETELRTGLSAFKRTLTLAKAEEAGFDLFLYVGPDDDVTREFCQERVDRVFTREEIATWDNGQGLPADIYLGGYNCRHDLTPITEADARALGYL